METPQFDPRDRTWVALKSHLLDHVELLRNGLEAKALDEGSTEYIRGKLAALRYILSLETPTANPVR